VPHEAIVVGEPETHVSLGREDGRAGFQAIIVSTGGLVRDALASAARAQLEALERDFGIRYLGCDASRPHPADGTDATGRDSRPAFRLS
jgi:hypothetical protein